MDTKVNIRKSEWVKACLKAQSQTINICMKLLQYRCLMMACLKPAILKRYSGPSRYMCKGLIEKGTLIFTVYGNVLS